nr:phage/plasmid primase, P4 family [uncultured Desulfobacter sp.]
MVVSNNIEVKLNNIPEELTLLVQWVVWNGISNGDKIKKVPVDPKTGKSASVSDPSTWGSFEQAVSAYQGRGYSGIGFVFTKNDPYVGIDFDHCFNEEMLAPEVLQYISRLDSYTEFSPSGRGIHTIVKGALPGGGLRHNKIEAYDTGRFFTVTGNICDGVGEDIKESQHGLDFLLADHFPRRKQNIGTNSTIIEELFNKKNGTKLKSLWNGQYLHLGYESQSEADLALCKILSHYFDGNLIKVDRFFRQSGLYREKWDEVHSTTGETYGDMTLDKIQSFSTHSPHPKSDIPAFKCTDLGNAERLKHYFGDQLRYCHPWSKWVVWDGIKWSEDNTGTINQRAKKTVRKIADEAKQFQDDNKRRAIKKHAESSESNGRIKSMVTLARSELPVRPEKFDRNRFLLNCKNGTIDLSTGRLKPHDKEDYITKAVSIHYDPDAMCPQWENFMFRIMDNNEDLIRFLQRAIGYALTGDVSEQCFFILWGEGDNGKSTFSRTIGNILGDYSQHMPIDTLIIKKKGAASNDVARLKGSRFVTASESEKGDRLAETLVKQLTGDDIISARFLYQETFEFEAEHKLFLATNNKLIIAGNDHAIWRRIKLIPFQVKIPEEEKDTKLPEKLKAEYSGILNWAIKGCLEWQRYGLGTPAEVTEATEEYRNEMDLLNDFLNECCDTGPELYLPSKDLYQAYTKWCEDNGEFRLKQTTFGRKLKEKGFESKQLGKKRTRCWLGLDLVEGVELA